MLDYLRSPPDGVFGTSQSQRIVANHITTYIQEAREELKKVLWPNRKETIRSSLLVIGISLAVAALLGAVDFLLNIVVEQVIR